MKLIILLSLLVSTSSLTAQIYTSLLDQNNAGAHLTDQGFLFHQPGNNNAGYEYPKGSNKHLIYTSSMWHGGFDINGQLKLAAQSYHPTDQDFWAGPLELITANYVAPTGLTIWSVNKADILYHIANYTDPTYSPPTEITLWPAHGDTTLGLDYYLAPFYDVDGNGKYEPENGDYPCINGDKATYIIINDKGNVHTSGGNPIGLENHYMIYQYSTVPELEGVTFVNVNLKNRGTQSIFDFNSTVYIDFDLGNYTDDYIGSDSSRNLIYAYNADNFDEDNAGLTGYGEAPPAVGVVSLSSPMTKAGYSYNTAPSPMTEPSSAFEYNYTMNGKWIDGSSWLDNNGFETSFMFSSDPNDPSGWSEYQEANIPGDRKAFMTIDTLSTLVPFTEREYTYAIVPAQGTDNLNSVTELFSAVDFVQDFFDNQVTNCYELLVSIDEEENHDFELFPNPATNSITIQLENELNDAKVIITDLTGKVVSQESFNSTSNINMTLDLPSSVYQITISTEEYRITKRLIIQ